MILTMDVLNNPGAAYPHLWFTRYCFVRLCPEMPMFYFAGLQFRAAPSLDKLAALCTFALHGQPGGQGEALDPQNLADGALDHAQQVVQQQQAPNGGELDEALDGQDGMDATIAGMLGGYNEANGPDHTYEGNLPIGLAQQIQRYNAALNGVTQAFDNAGFNTLNIGIPQPIGA